MPFYSKLKSRMRRDGKWKDTYEQNLSHAQQIAERIPLIHVTADRRPGRVSFAELFEPDVPVLPTSEHLGFCSDGTRAAEDTLGLPRSVYFYAGRAEPEFGDVALAFDPGTEASHTGSATAFDTGGLVGEYPRCLKCTLTDAPPEEKRTFARRSTVRLRCWRKFFKHQLAAYFSTPADYWDGRPAYEDPEELYSPQRANDHRAWTAEVRFQEPQPLSEVAAWCPRSIYWRKIQKLVDRRAPMAPRRPGLQKFLTTHHPLRPGGDPDYCRVIEDWARSRAGV
jgi:hypothetical protein